MSIKKEGQSGLMGERITCTLLICPVGLILCGAREWEIINQQIKDIGNLLNLTLVPFVKSTKARDVMLVGC